MVVYICQKLYIEQVLPLAMIKGQGNRLATFVLNFYVNVSKIYISWMFEWN